MIVHFVRLRPTQYNNDKKSCKAPIALYRTDLITNNKWLAIFIYMHFNHLQNDVGIRYVPEVNVICTISYQQTSLATKVAGVVMGT